MCLSNSHVCGINIMRELTSVHAFQLTAFWMTGTKHYIYWATDKPVTQNCSSTAHLLKEELNTSLDGDRC
jgi:hypothetical protein